MRNAGQNWHAEFVGTWNIARCEVECSIVALCAILHGPELPCCELLFNSFWHSQSVTPATGATAAIELTLMMCPLIPAAVMSAAASCVPCIGPLTLKPQFGHNTAERTPNQHEALKSHRNSVTWTTRRRTVQI